MASKLFLSNSSFLFQSNKLLSFPKHLNPISTSQSRSLTITNTSFNWDDVLSISQSNNSSEDHDSSYLQPFFQRIKTCNRGMEKKSEFFQFIVEDQIIGYIHEKFAENLRKFKDVFTFGEGDIGVNIMLHSSLESPDDRTDAVGYVIKSLGEGLIPGIRNEAYGVHMNGYVDKDGEKYLWVGKRSEVKPTYPGMLDHLVAGGLPHDMTCKENILKECEEEAGIPSSISNSAIPVGAVSYMDIDGDRYKRDVLFCYDLKVNEGFTPNNQDGEVGSFKLIPIKQVANIIRTTEFFKPNCTLVIIDFLFRHGIIKPEQRGYLELLQSLRSGDCS
ncbi:hypothetical protein ACHQM5_011111 [Ranunculus cassubicifolius]